MYLIQTVQTSWRPQLPLPKEVDLSPENAKPPGPHHHIDESAMDRLHQAHGHHQQPTHGGSKKDNSLNAPPSAAAHKKWSFGRLFRKKKDIETDSSSEEDRKAGFVPAAKYGAKATASKPTATGAAKANRSNRGSKLIGFDHIVVSPTQHHNNNNNNNHMDNEFFLPVETIKPHPHLQQLAPYDGATRQSTAITRSSNSLDRRSALAARPQLGHKSRSAQRVGGVPVAAPNASSGEEELISLNSSTFSKYRSDESIHSGGVAHPPNGASGQSRRSRAARNERYYKRLSRDGEVSHGQVPVMYAPQPVQRWKTQPVPLSVYSGPSPAPPQPAAAASHQRLRNTTSLQHMGPYVQWGQMQKQQHQAQVHPPQGQSKGGLQNTVNDAKRSISYDSHIHLQNANGRLQTKPLPPPPPPRDPLRRVNVNGERPAANGSAGDLRPLSYAFDPNGLAAAAPAGRLNSRCVSDDKIWAGQGPLHYQSAHSLNVPGPQRRFITRAERDAQPSKKSLPNGLDFHYVADATPRSRKPIHLLQPAGDELEPPSTGILRTTKSGLPSAAATKQAASDFWKRLDEGSQRRGRNPDRLGGDCAVKPRSVSTSRVGELRSYPIPLYSEVYKPMRPAATPSAGDEVDNVVCGSLHIKPTGQDSCSNYVEIRHKDEATPNKSSSMPNHYQRRSGELPATPNKYEEYVAEKLERHHKPSFNPPTPPQRKPSVPPVYVARKKPANLEEAINELEAIYKSLGLSEEARDRPGDFEKFALAHADEYDDEDSPTGEPDPIRDDVAYRHIQLANLQHKTADKQPPFGIPIGPIVPSPHTDYLHVSTEAESGKATPLNAPDVVKDDLAVRALRKDPPGPKEKFLYPGGGSLPKKHRATRTQSANIYSLIQRDAAKPSGGDLYSFMELAKSLDRAGSMSDIHREAHDIPSTLTLLRQLKEQEDEPAVVSPPKHVQVPFRHPSQLGAIGHLPEILAKHGEQEQHKGPGPGPVPLPRKSLTPEPTAANHQMEDALNQIAKDAQESSVKLGRELQELRKEALITAAKPKATATSEEEQLVKDLQEIEAVSEAAKRCGKMLLDTLPDEDAAASRAAPRKLHGEGQQLIQAIDEVSEAANAVCEKILKDIVTAEPPIVVQQAIQVRNAGVDQPLVMPHLIKKLDPVQSDQIEAIAQRCMRQISELAVAAEPMPDYDNLRHEETRTVACNRASGETPEPRTNCHTHVCTVAEGQPAIEEIDKIMQECEQQVRVAQSGQPTVTATSTGTTTTVSSFSSSSDCLAKSSSPSSASRRRQSSSLTSFNPYSSSDYLKSPSSEYHAPSTDPIKTFSTTSYDVPSTSSATPNITTNSTFSCTPSPPLQLTPVGERKRNSTTAPDAQSSTSSPSQYNSSEELAMIFGIEERSRGRSHHERKPTAEANISGNIEATTKDHPTADPIMSLLTTNTNTTTATKAKATCSSSAKPNQPPATPLTATNLSLLRDAPAFVNVLDSPTSSTTTTANSYKLLATIPETPNEPSEDPHEEEEVSSNPDSGNVSLADYPLSGGSSVLQLHTACNSRYEVRKPAFISEVSIPPDVEFPPLPTEQELLESLKERATKEEALESIPEIAPQAEEDLTELQVPSGARKRNVVYETPQLSMSISEVREVPESGNEEQAFGELPQLRRRPQGPDDPSRPSTSVQAAAASSEESSCDSLVAAPPMTLSLLGELRPANRLTTLEHILMACTLGVITPNDLFTLCLVVVAVITIVAMIML